MGILREPIWEDLPQIERRGGFRKLHWRDILVLLVAQPLKWARVAEYDDSATARTAAWTLRGIDFSSLGKGYFEFENKGKFVYSRYVIVRRKDS